MRFIDVRTSSSRAKLSVRKTPGCYSVGAAGTGKTRLALQAAASLAYDSSRESSSWTSRAPRAHAVAEAIARRWIFGNGGDGLSLMEALQGYLAKRQVLLILDNFEHLLPAAGDAATLLPVAQGFHPGHQQGSAALRPSG